MLRFKMGLEKRKVPFNFYFCTPGTTYVYILGVFHSPRRSSKDIDGFASTLLYSSTEDRDVA